jgi:hypothetical protein
MAPNFEELNIPPWCPVIFRVSEQQEQLIRHEVISLGALSKSHGVMTASQDLLSHAS